jgi:gliding-associated putative ABC transporter substrate-binding component GldG
MNAPRKQLAITSAAGLVLFGLFLVLVNVVANWVYLRFDLTARHAYSLSSSSKRLVKELEDPLVIKVYFTPDLPSPYNTYGRYVRDLLTEYRGASHGKVRFEFMLPAPQKEFEQRAMEAGLAPVQFQEAGSNQLNIRRGFMGLVMYYRDKTEVIPAIRSVDGLEYDITTRLARMARRQKKVIAFTSGHNEMAWRTPQSPLAQTLGDMFEFQDWALPMAATTTLKADALFVVGPRQAFDAKSQWAIDQAIMRGIPTAFLLDSRTLALRQFMVSPQNTGLNPLLQHYGIVIGDQLVCDEQSENVSMTQNIGGLALTTSVRYQFIPLVTLFPKSHPILRDIDSVGLPFAYRLDKSTTSATGTTMIPLLMSSERSWLAPAETYRVSPDAVPPRAPDSPTGPYVLGALLEGTFSSYFQNQPSPVAGQTLVGTSPKTKVFVLGTSQILNPDVPGFPGVDGFLTNLMAYMSNDDLLLGIRSKGELLRPLKPVSGATRQLVKLLVLLGVPLAAMAWGLFRWRRRQAWRRQVARAMEAPAAI